MGELSIYCKLWCLRGHCCWTCFLHIANYTCSVDMRRDSFIGSSIGGVPAREGRVWKHARLLDDSCGEVCAFGACNGAAPQLDDALHLHCLGISYGLRHAPVCIRKCSEF